VKHLNRTVVALALTVMLVLTAGAAGLPAGAEAPTAELVSLAVWQTSPDMSQLEEEQMAKFPDLAFIGSRPKAGCDPDRAEQYLMGLLEARVPYYEANAQDLANLALQMGGNHLYTSVCAPLVFIEVPESVVSDIEGRSDVEQVYYAGTYEEEIDSAVPTVRAGAFWGAGYDGTGSRVAIVESSRADFANPWISGTTHNAGWAIGYHPTVIAGVIASTHATYSGMGPGISLMSANAGGWTTAQLTAASDWALRNGAHVLSCSYGMDTNLNLGPLDRYYDHVTWEHWRLVTKSCGNRGWGDGDVTSPGLGWNVIAVGSIDDNDTSNWADDTRSGFSSYGDPNSPNGDRNKPEVSAVGEGIRSTETSAYFGTYGTWITRTVDAHAGTSFAGPAVAGEAALIIDRVPWLRIWPEVTRSVIMATARMAYGSIINGNTPDDREGCGTIDAQEALRTLNNGWYIGTGTWDVNNYPLNYSFYAVAGERVRVVLNWDSHTNWHVNANYDSLCADLDLYIYSPRSRLIGASCSWDNNYELVEFQALETGWHTMEIRAYRYDYWLEYLGIAWTRQ